MKRISATKFKEQCTAILDDIDGDGVLITKGGKPVATLYPVHAESSGLIGSMKKKIRIKGDILSTGLEWNAQP